ncbi:MAG TPA: UDP-N-acetylmuramate--L-alanine ligase, partial [Chloroflexi bacterium]|nr:UDP-N-acetylmuramate--L-alanine ligase [Chloroflexota bacterium]
MSSKYEQGLPQHIHMVGIGGIGLSAIARVLSAWGHEVTGSDLVASAATRALNDLGIRTYVGHAAKQVKGAGMVVISSAVPENNPEIQAAREWGIPVVKRQDLLGRMMAGRRGVAVAGTHGKTTTSAMIAHMLEQAMLSPTFIVGGIVGGLNTNARAGNGAHFVIEADEYDRMFHGLNPQIAVVTNVEMDHPDCYRDIDDMREAYAEFLDRVPADGYIVACSDSPHLVGLLSGRAPRVVTYGTGEGAAFRVSGVRANARGGIDFNITTAAGPWGGYSLSVPGVHNALNATAALISAELCGLDRFLASRHLRVYGGVLRRFELKGERSGVTVVDDYAHHPTEVRATLAAARQRYPERRIWAVFQPHTYSRASALLGDLATCFEGADRVLVTDIYAARSRESATIRAEDIVAAVNHNDARYIGGID